VTDKYDDDVTVNRKETCAKAQERDEIWDAKLGCPGIIVPGAHGGGVRCNTCSGWFCF
jgi:hypothetical protein